MRQACVFCQPEALDGVLDQTEHLFLLADNAPLVEGHVLIVPRDHYACYGAVPAKLDAEYLELKTKVSRFMKDCYRLPLFFEHGVYRQTVAHAHLHALPLSVSRRLADHALTQKGLPAVSQDDLRRWYETNGKYFYLEKPNADYNTHFGAIFPPDESVYFRVQAVLREGAESHGGWLPQALRRQIGRPQMERLKATWHTWQQRQPADGVATPD